MKYIIMAAGEGKRWHNYLGIPKHLVEINDETLLGRTTRLLRENGIEDYEITANNEIYGQYGKIVEQSEKDCEIDRFTRVGEPVCFLYGDVYYTEEAIKTIINAGVRDVVFLGSGQEIFAVKVNDLELFYEHKNKVKELYLSGKIGRCIGWELYRSINGIPLDKHWINGRYIYIEDDTDDIDYPEDYDNFRLKREKK